MELAFLRYLGGTILEVMEKHGDRQLFTFYRIEKFQEIFKMIHMMCHYM